jgi:hypothetical protein
MSNFQVWFLELVIIAKIALFASWKESLINKEGLSFWFLNQ